MGLYVERLERDWANVLARAEGRRVVYDILSMCGLFQSSYRGNADTNFLEGQRNVALILISERITPTGGHLFPQMLAEHSELVDTLEAATG